MNLLKTISDFIFPRRCAVCGKRLMPSEEGVCGACTFTLPYTGFRGRISNPVERMFWGRFPFGRASSYMYYYRDTDSRNVIFWLKYYGHQEIGIQMGRRMASELKDTDFFEGMDFIVPVPLSRQRLHKRGYNQSTLLAKGVEQVTGIRVLENVLCRKVNNPTQTHFSHNRRMENVKGIFGVKNEELVKNRHFLIIDDVITTGATVTACADALVAAGAARISVLSLAVTHFIEKV